jgi:flagellar biogenesis protein FliO
VGYDPTVLIVSITVLKFKKSKMMNISNTIKLVVTLLVVGAFVVTRLNSSNNVSVRRRNNLHHADMFFLHFKES